MGQVEMIGEIFWCFGGFVMCQISWCGVDYYLIWCQVVSYQIFLMDFVDMDCQIEFFIYQIDYLVSQIQFYLDCRLDLQEGGGQGCDYVGVE